MLWNMKSRNGYTIGLSPQAKSRLKHFCASFSSGTMQSSGFPCPVATRCASSAVNAPRTPSLMPAIRSGQGSLLLFCFSIAAIMPAYSRSASSAPTIIPGTPVNSACTIRLSCTCSLLRQSCRLQSGSRRRGHFQCTF